MPPYCVCLNSTTRPSARNSFKVLPKQSTPGGRSEGGCTRPLAFTVTRRCPASCNVDGRTILADFLEIADPPRLGLFTKADDCEREVGEPFGRQIQSPR